MAQVCPNGLADLNKRLSVLNAAQQQFTLCAGAAPKRGEREYSMLVSDFLENWDMWMALFSDDGNSVYCERICGILGTLATLYRWRGHIERASRVLELEDIFLKLYEGMSERSTSRAQKECAAGLRYKYLVILYNLLLNFGHSSGPKLCDTLRKLILHELTHKFSFEQQNFAFMVQMVHHKKPTIQLVKKMSDKDLQKINNKSLSQPHDPKYPLAVSKEDYEFAQLKKCGKCNRGEEFLGDFKLCGGCRYVRYCTAECQKAHWPTHKVLCKQMRGFY